nr:response regulator transcription factor [uncultured Oscillibacter sp.]
MIKKRILIVEDDLSICRLMEEQFQNDRTDVFCVPASAGVLDIFMTQEYCLVIMDVQLSEADSLKMLNAMRAAKHTPILALTSSLKPENRAALLQAGANAYLEKPVNMNVCVAQAEALMKLYCESNHDYQKCCPLKFGAELIINPLYRQVFIDGEPIELTRTEFDLLFCLAQHPGQVWSRSQLYSYVWEDDLGAGDDNTVRAHIGNLRKKLADAGKNYIENSRGVGYRFVPPVLNMKN